MANHAFTYDGIFDEESTQEEVYAALGRPVLHDVLEGMHGCGARAGCGFVRLTTRGVRPCRPVISGC